MSRPKNSSHDIHVYLELAALEALRAEAERLMTRPGKLLSKLIIERTGSFCSRPIQLMDKLNM
jgi:hypothetical protein